MLDLKLGKASLAGFSAPAIPLAALGLPVVVYLPPFYANTMGLGLTVVGAVFMLTRFWDVVTDPMMGVVSDRFQSRWGRRKHWLVLGTPLVLICVSMLYMPRPPVGAGYLLGWMILLYLGWTLLFVNHVAWGSELSLDYHERSRVQGWVQMATIVGQILVLALPSLVEQFGEPTLANKVQSMGWFVIVLLPLAVLASVISAPDQTKIIQRESRGWQQALGLVWQNRPLRRLLLADLLSGTQTGILAALYMFFMKYAVDLGESGSTILLAFFLAGCVCTPIWLRVSSRIGKHRALVAASIFNVLTVPLVIFIPPGNFWFALFCFVLFGSNTGATPFLLRSIMSDVTDLDSVESGERRTGVYFSLLSLTNKLGLAIAVGVTYSILDWIGFDPRGENSKSAIDGLRLMYYIPPVVFPFLISLIMWNFPIDRDRQSELRRQMEQAETI